MKLIPFQHRYAKLAKPEFTTVRGPSFALHLRPASVAAARTPDAEFPVEVVSVRYAKLRDIPVELLREDVRGHADVADHAGFAAVINSFRTKPWMPKVTLDSELAVITLRKVECQTELHVGVRRFK